MTRTAECPSLTSHSSRGFTMAELTMAVAIMLVIAAMAVPGIAAARRSYEISTAGFTVASKLDEARTNALKRNRQAWVLINGPGQNLQVQYTDSGGTTVNVGNVVFLPQSVTFPSVTTTQQMLFDAMGRPAAPLSVQIQHAQSGQTRTINVASTGRIWVQ